MSDIYTLAANMRNAFVERKSATIGGGEFTPEELRAGSIAIRALPEVLTALQQLHDSFREHSAAYRNGLDDTDALYSQVSLAISKGKEVLP